MPRPQGSRSRQVYDDKTLASKLMRNAAATGSMRRKRKAAALDGDFHANLVEE